MGTTGRVVAVEPAPENAAALRRNVGLNQLGQVTVVEAAVCDAVGRASFNLAGDDQSGKLGNGDRSVATTTVDDQVRRTGYAPDVVKIDVEGAEDRAITGMMATLREHQPVIVCEMHSGRASFDDQAAR